MRKIIIFFKRLFCWHDWIISKRLTQGSHQRCFKCYKERYYREI